MYNNIILIIGLAILYIIGIVIIVWNHKNNYLPNNIKLIPIKIKSLP